MRDMRALSIPSCQSIANRRKGDGLKFLDNNSVALFVDI